MNPQFIESQWATLCRSAQSTTAKLIDGVCPQAADLMQAEIRKLCESACPHDKASLEAMYTRRMALSARITAIVRADAMIRVHPDAADQIIAELEKFCDGDFPAAPESYLDMQTRNVELTRAIADLCHAEMAGRA